MKRIYFLVSILCILLASACSSGPRTVKLDENANGQSVELKVGESLQISLASDPINGYGWQVEKIAPAYLEYSPQNAYTPVGKDPVAGGTQVLTFKALKPGNTTLGLTYQRASGEGVSLPKIFEIQVNIQ